MISQLTAIYEPNPDGTFLAQIAELPNLKVRAKSLETARSQLTKKLQRSLDEARTRSLDKATEKARIEPILVKSRKRGGARTGRSRVAKSGRSPARPELDLLQCLREQGLIDDIPSLDLLDDNFEPIPIEGRPISEELIEDRR